MVIDISSLERKGRVLLLALFSEDYPMIGESHSLSVLGGCLENKLTDWLDALEVIDMYGLDYRLRDEALLKILNEFQPNIVGISVPYGSYVYLREVYPRIKALLIDKAHLVIFGGPIPTYIPEIILKEIDNTAIIVCGEGDEAIVEIIRNWLNKKSLEGIKNICYLMGNKPIYNERSLVNLLNIPPPYRKHINQLAQKGAQIFTESSRGCSWGVCTFCPRGLLDMQGALDYRCFPLTRLRQDILVLRDRNIQVITFADEDFLGGHRQQCEQLVAFLEELTKVEGLQLCFDVSMTVQSIYSLKWTSEELNNRKSLLKRLKNIGLRKVFLGIESGSVTQLARYKKGHKPEEAVSAIEFLRELGATIEIGFIMFDPLCDLYEIEENIQYLRKNNLTGFVSSLGSGLELRLQLGSPYITLLKEAERKFGLKLFERNLDFNTLIFPTTYANPEVNKVVCVVRNWNARIRPLYYPLKSLSRYGTGGLLGDLVKPVKLIVVEMREAYLQRMLETVTSIKLSGDIDHNINEQFDMDVKKLSIQIINIFKDAPPAIINHPMIFSILDNARKKAQRT